MNMYARVLPPDSMTTYMVSRLFYEKHIYLAMDDAMKDVWTVHTILKEIEQRERLCVGVFQKNDDRFLGCTHGLITAGYMNAHLLFYRHIDALSAVKLCMDECRKYYREHDLPLQYFQGKVSDENRCVKLLLRKLGWKDEGVRENDFFISRSRKIPCRIYRKEVE